jgi:hypothetical protein
VSNLLSVVPLAFVMVAGPQLVSAIFLATSDRARSSSAAYVLGVTLATVLGTTIVYVIANVFGVGGGSKKDSGASWVDYALIGLLLVLMVRVYLKRKETEPPKWMGKLAKASPKFSFGLGLGLFLVMPTDVITMITVGTYLARHDASLLKALPFLFLTVLLISIPLLVLLIMGKRADAVLASARGWMNANSWVVSEVVIVFFLAVTIAGIS